MRAERRKHRRAPISGMRVAYEDAAGLHAEADVLDVGVGGMFVRCDRPVPVGRGLTIEITGPGEGAHWSALGRVVWVRSGASPGGPSGMGVRFVDAEQAMLARIEELVAARERTDLDTGGTKTPAREQTVLGVGAPQTAEASAAPIIAVAPMAREKTVLGMGAPEAAPAKAELPDHAAALDRSVPIELVAAKVKVEAEPKRREAELKPDAPEPSEGSLVAAGVPRRRSGVWLVVLLLLVGGGYAAYAQRARIPWLNAMIERGSAAVGAPAPAPPPPPPAPTPTPSPVSTPSAPTSAIEPAIGSAASTPSLTPSAPAPSASTKPTSSASTKPTSSASTAPARKPPARAPAPRHGASDRGGDNPY